LRVLAPVRINAEGPGTEGIKPGEDPVRNEVIVNGVRGERPVLPNFLGQLA